MYRSTYITLCSLNSAATSRSSGGQPKSAGGFGACSEVPFILKEFKHINWDTLGLDIWIPDHYIDTSNSTL